MRSVLFAITCMWAAACTAPLGGAHEPSAPARDIKRESDMEANQGTVSARPESSSGKAPPSYSCGDTVLNDQASSGGEQLTHSVPCMPVQPATTSSKPIPPPDPDPSEAATPDVAAPLPVPQPPPKKKGPAIQGYKPKK